jgi:hypothetical protein
VTDWIRKALTRKTTITRVRGKRITEDIEPDERLVYAVKFAIGITFCLSALQVAHLAFLHAWNSEIFAAITGLVGTVMGIFVGQKVN